MPHFTVFPSDTQPMPTSGESARWAQWGAALVALVVFLPALGNGFAFDDEPAIVTNSRVHALGRLWSLLTNPYWPQHGTLWRPVTQLSFALDWAAGGGAPLPFHLGNLLLHALAAALVTRLALVWLPAGGAIVAGLLFAVAPVHIEVVANSVGRAELLCAVGLLGAVLCALRSPGSAKGIAWPIALFTLLAFGAKETGVVAPALVYAAGWLGSRDLQVARRRAAPSAMIVALLLALRWLVLGTFGGDAVHHAWHLATGWTGGLLALSMLPQALWLAVAPQRLPFEHSPTAFDATHPSLLLATFGLLMVVGALWAAYALWRRPSVAAFGVVIAAVTFLPVANLLFRTGIVLAERSLYAPSIGLALLAAAGATRVAARWPMAPGFLVVCWAAPAAAVTALDAPRWRSSASVYDTMTTRNPTAYMGWWYLGLAQMRDGDETGAYTSFATAVQHFDGDGRVLHAASQRALARHDTTRALPWLDRAVEIAPADRLTRALRINVAIAQRDTARATMLLREGLAREPDQRLWRQQLDRLRQAP